LNKRGKDIEQQISKKIHILKPSFLFMVSLSLVWLLFL